jgi:hypothetical protein
VRNTWWPPRTTAARSLTAGLVIAVVATVALVAAALSPAPTTSTASPTAPGGGIGTASPSAPAPSATVPAASPTPEPTPPVVLVPAPMTGLLVTPEAALRHPMAIMIDDHQGARPQSGFNSAAVVWHAPAEGGIPRYMLIFQDTIPAAVGPVRSARQYYIEWAAEWNAMYAHAGGSPQALDTLRRFGRGQLVWNADEFRWSELGYFWRVHDRVAPHNLYTDGAHLRKLAGVLGMQDEPMTPKWTFEFARPDVERPVGNVIKVVYPYESITYRFDPIRNKYLRYINGSKRPQIDGADGQYVTPTNVVILRMHFGPLQNSDPKKHRLEADDIGHGEAWISTGGLTIKGTWRKASASAPTLLFDAQGQPVTLLAGQTFVQVLPLTYSFSITKGRLPVVPEPMPGDVLAPS